MSARTSLSLRLMLAAAATIGLALVIAGFGLAYLFEQHVERRVERELDNYLSQLIVAFGTGSNAADTPKITLSDPRFRIPYSGLYWQINDTAGMVSRSRSPWDFELDIKTETNQITGVQEYIVPGPEDTQLVSLTHKVIPPGASGKQYRFTVALDHGEVSKAVAAFALELGASLVVLAVFLLAAAWAQVTIGLIPLDRLRRQVLAVRDGRSKRIGDGHPSEVRPLIDEINTLLDQQEAAMERARAHAGNLAHGLKTPLTVLGAESRRLQSGGEPGIAAEIDAQISTMNRHIERELARARIRGTRLTGGARADLAPAIDQIVATLRRLPRGASVNGD
ncbi:MAG: sensor histidine kinase, partial [Hyphomicrobiales bacterium]